MNPDKQRLISAEKFHKQKSDFLDLISKSCDIEAKINAIISILKYNLEDEIRTIEHKIPALKSNWIQSFEAESAEVNHKLGGALMMAQKLVGQEPLVITDKIGELIPKLKAAEDQEEKNDLFYEMMGHVNFIKTNVK